MANTVVAMMVWLAMASRRSEFGFWISSALNCPDGVLKALRYPGPMSGPNGSAIGVAFAEAMNGPPLACNWKELDAIIELPCGIVPIRTRAAG